MGNRSDSLLWRRATSFRFQQLQHLRAGGRDAVIGAADGDDCGAVWMLDTEQSRELVFVVLEGATGWRLLIEVPQCAAEQVE